MSIRSWLLEQVAQRAGIAPEAIDADERFKSLGLSSLAVTSMLAALGEKLGRTLSPTLAWEHPTPNELARHLDEAPRAAGSSGTELMGEGDEPIAVVGLSCRFPGAPDPVAFWRLLSDGVDAIREVPADRWDLARFYDEDPAAPGKMSTRWGGFLPQVDRFDPAFFGIAPREAIQIDPQQRLALELSWEALEDAGIVPASLRDSRTGVFFGAMWMDYLRQLEGAADQIVQHTATGQDLSIVAARVSYTLGAMGPSLTVNTACSSSLVAVHLACQSLLRNESRLALAGGFNLLIAPESTIAMTKFGAMAPDGRSKAFDARANGYVRGEGGGVVALKRLSQARADGDRIYCVIRGSAINNDGFSNGLTAPSPAAQRAVLADACARAGVAPADVQYVEAHGTGTMLGDPIEANALGAVLGQGRPASRPLRVGSVKTNIGHLEAAAGMAGLIKVALSMQHRSLPKSLHFQKPNPHIDFEQIRLRVQAERAPWEPEGGRLLAGVSSFGFGGTNSHVILEHTVADAPALLALAADSEAELRQRAAALASRAASADAPGLESLCSAEPTAGTQRLATVVPTRAALQTRLAAFSRGEPAGSVFVGRDGGAPRVCMLFTGQGAQAAGMGRRLASTEPAFRDALERVAALFASELPKPLLEVMWAPADSGEANLLHRTAYTQPALFALEYAMAELWRARGVLPDLVIGHSIGEIAAACVASAFSLPDAVRLVAARGRLMDALPSGGAMVALAASEARVAPLLAAVSDRAAIAAVNGAQHTVIAGAEDAVLPIAAALEAEGIKARRLTVSHAFHSPLMAPMRKEFRRAVQGVRAAPLTIPLITNLDGRLLAKGETIPSSHWVDHVEAPVRFAQGLATLAQLDPDLLLEVGPHPVLLDLAAEVPDLRARRVASLERGADEVLVNREAMAQLYAAGAEVRVAPASPGASPAGGQTEPQLFVVSGRGDAALRGQCQQLARHLAESPEPSLADLAFSLATSRGAHETRCAVVARSATELQRALELAGRGEPAVGAAVGAVSKARGKLAFLFSGQGSQVLGMGRELHARWPAFRRAFDEAAAQLDLHLPRPLREVIWAAPSSAEAALLDQTAFTQPALFAVEWALAALWRSLGAQPDLVAGHSVGELVAACLAGVFGLEDAAKLVCARGQLMQALPAGGAMLSVAAAQADVQAWLSAEARGEVEIAAVNGPAQVVLAGPHDALSALARAWGARGIRVKPLTVSHAFHSAQMDAMLPAFAEVAGALRYHAPSLPLASCLTGALADGSIATADYWVRHARAPVLFAQAVQALRAAGANAAVEIGPRATLLGLIPEILPGEPLVLAASLRSGKPEDQSLLAAAGELWTAGVPLQLRGLFCGSERRVQLPTYAWQRQRYWIDRRPLTAGPAATGDHPLLGAQVAVAGEAAVHQSLLSLQSHPWLGDHRVFGRAVVPGAAIAELVRAAGEAALGGPVTVQELLLQAPLLVPEQGARRVQVTVTPSSGQVEVHSQSGSASPAEPWQLQATAKVQPAAPQAQRRDLPALQRQIDQPLDVDDIYSRFGERGLDYGPAFRKLEAVWRGEAQALARLSPAELEGTSLSPLALDAAIQAALAGLRSEAELALPFEFGRVLHHAAGHVVWVHARELPQEGLRLELLDASSTLLAEASGLRLIAADASKLSPPGAKHTQAPDGMFTLHWREQPPQGGPPASAPRVEGWAVVAASGSAWGQALAAQLPDARLVDLATLTRQLAAGEVPGGVAVLCESLPGESVPAAAQRLATEGLALVQALSAARRSVRLRWVTRGAVDARGGERWAPAALAGSTAWGLARTVRHELPELDARAIDVEAGTSALELTRELSAADDEPQVALRQGSRMVLRLARAPSSPSATPPALKGTVLITGGLGALGLQLARSLASQQVPHLILTGRRGLQTPGAREAVAELEALGARITVSPVDVADRGALASLLAGVPAELPLCGVIHAAGVLDDGVLAEQTPERFTRVLSPKIDGAWNLHELTADAPLDLFVLFSSVSGLLGAAGQGNYAAANTFLDALALHRRAHGLPAQSLWWGPWAAVGMAARMGELQRARLERQGMGSWSAAEGLDRFRAALARRETQLGLIRFDLAAVGRAVGAEVPALFRELLRAPAPSAALPRAGQAVAPPSGALAERLAVLEPARREAAVREEVSAEVARVLSWPGPVPLDQPLSELGLDSLMAVELRNGLGRRVGATLPATVAFDYPTVKALSGWLLAEVLQIPGGEALTQAPSAVASEDHEPIAIVGFGCRYPGGVKDARSFWELLSQGRDAVSEMPRQRWNIDELYDPNPDAPGKISTRQGGFVEPIDQFDAGFFGISPREADGMDPQQRLLLETTWEALEHAGIVPEQLAGTDAGVFVGFMYQEYASLGPGLAGLDGYGITGSLGSVASGRLSYVLGLKGPSLTVDTACSSSLVTLHLACEALRRGECSVALAGGVALMLTPSVFVEFSRLRGLSADGRCKSFAAGADGVGWSEGCGMLVLKRLSQAQRDGDPILALVRGTAVNQDGRSNGLTAPNGPSQKAVIERALKQAGLSPAAVDYVECHGTGTKLGDPIEVQALGAALGPGRDRPVVIGSAKSNLGHTQAAAGAAGVMKVILALQHEEIPRSLHFDEPSPHIAWSELPVKVADEPLPWPRGERPRIAGVSSFGISGTNAHVILEEPPRPSAPRELQPPTPVARLCVVSAKSESALRESCGQLATHLDRFPAQSLADLSHSLAITRSPMEQRLALVARTRDELQAALAAAARGELPNGATRGERSAAGAPKLVFVFPGQGSQWLGMGRQLLEAEPAFRAAMEACDSAIQREAGISLLAELAATEESSQLSRIDVVQPLLFAFGVSLAALWRSWGFTPDAVVGHSMGEVAAAHVAGALSLADAAAIICRRSALMRRLSGQGAMAVVELSMAQAEAALSGLTDRLSVAVSNSPRSTVISGDPQALDQVLAGLQAKGIFCRRVKVDVASHSPQVESLREELQAALAEVRPMQAQLSMHSTVRDALVQGPELTAGYWVDNLRQPVRFLSAVEALLESGHGLFVEMSPHPLLTTSVEEVRRAAGRFGAAVGSLRRGQDERASLMESLGALWVAGQAPDWSRLAASGARRVELPVYPFQRERHWLPAGPERNAPLLPVAGHPLLGEGQSLSTQQSTRLWQTQLGLPRLGFLRDHRVQGATVFPAAGYFEMALTAAGELFGTATGLQLANLSLGEALAFAGADATVPVQLVAKEEKPGLFSFQIASRLAAKGAPSWRVHARGELRAAAAADSARLDLAQLRERLGPAVESAAVYAELEAMELPYGPAFRGIAQLWRQPGEALGRVALPASAGSEQPYRVHPALLDACLQVALAGALAGPAESAPWVPVELGSLALYREPGQELFCHARLSAGHGEARRTADLLLVDAKGEPVAALKGLVCQRLESGAQVRPEDGWFLELDWVPSPRPEARAAAGRVLLIGDVDARELRAALEQMGHRVAQLGHLDAPHLRTQLAAAFDGLAPTAVVHLGSLEIAAGARLPDLEHALQRGSDSVLATAQAIVAAGFRDPPRLWLVTTSAQAVVPGDDVAVLQAPLHGLARVIALEHPELRCVRLDLSAGVNLAEALAAELAADDGEEEIALREGQRWVARLAQRVPETTAAEREEPASGRPHRLEIDAPGVIERLALRELTRRAPGPHEVEIAVEAAGLNFLDVLLTLGVMPNDVPGAAGQPVTPGSELAGRICALGEGVSGLTLGQRVLAIAPRGGFASHVTLAETLVLPLPESLTAAEGAALPIAYLTAWYALDSVARLSRGDRVLIHAATGGVGLAAVQWAQHVGAEVFATAGTPEKRAYLESLGVRHISDSRSDQFVADVRAWTHGEGVDVVLNSLSGDRIEQSFKLLRSHGRFIELGKRDYYADHQLGLRPFLRNLTFSLVDLRGMMVERPEKVRALFQEFLALVQGGAFRPPPIVQVPLSRAQDAFHTMARGQHLGKLVLTVGADEPRLRVRAEQQLTVRRDGAYLITGGLGGLGLSAAAWLAERGAGQLMLMGRSGVTNQAQREAIAALEAAGAKVTLAKADVSDPAQVAQALSQLAESPHPLRGVIHAAGLLDDGLLAQQSPERLRRVMAPKVRGALVLHELTQALPLDFFVLYASGAGVLGSPGQANYAAANTLLDALAHHRRARGLPALSIDWGAFSEVGLAAQQDNRAARLEARGMRSLTPSEGLRALERLMVSDRAQVSVMPLDARQWVEFYPAAASSRMLAPLLAASQTKASSAQSQELRALLSAGSAQERLSLVQGVVRGQVARVLRLPEEKLDAEAPFTSLGMDSLTGLELRNRIEAAISITVPATLLWTYPTVAALSEHLASQLGPAGEMAAQPNPELPLEAAPAAEAPPEGDELFSFIDGLLDRASKDTAP